MMGIEETNEKHVAIIGMGLRLPGNCKSPLEFWNNLVDGFDGIVDTSDRWSNSFNDNSEISSKRAGLVDLDEWMSFDPLFFGINPTDAKQIDPQIKMMLKCTWEALEDAHVDPLSIRGTDTSVFVGASSTDYASFDCEPHETPVNVFNCSLSGFSNRISYCYDLRGTSLTIDTACSSSLNAVHSGYKTIVNGESDYSVVAGCNIILKPFVSRSFTSINITGKSGRCNAFDESADGFVRSEGVVVFILKRLSLAIKDGNHIYSVLKGSSSNVDGSFNKTNFFAPSKDAQTDNIKRAFKSTSGSLNYDDIDFFELHGTGTQVGDPTEVEAVSNVFKGHLKNGPLLIGSVKCNIGHLEPASGVASLAKVCLMFKHRQFVKNIHFNNPNPNIKFKEWNVKVVTENTPFPTDKKVSIAVNSFGITGSNACLLLSEFIEPSELLNNISPSSSPIKSNELSKLLIPISTNSKKSLDDYKSNLIDNIDSFSNDITFNQFVYYQSFSKTTKLSQRSVMVGNNWDDLINSETSLSFSTKNNKSGNIIKNNDINPTLVFSFCGQGPQHSKMGLELYQNEPIFKKPMDEIDSLLKQHFGYSIIEKLRSIDDNDKITINEPIIAQPSIFMIQISLFNLYKHWGITPSILVGHSFGEVSSAYCSGMIDLKTACFIIYKRALLQNKTNGSGKLLAIGLNLKEFNDKYSQSYPNIEISCYNSPSSIVICGDEIELLEISNSLKDKQIFSTLLGTPSAFHSSKQDIIKDEMIESTKDIESKLPTITTFSTVTSNQFDENTPYDSKYIFDNLRQPVLFQQTIENIFKYIELNDIGNNCIFLELSPHPTLNHYVKEMIPKGGSNYFDNDSVSVLSSLNKKVSDITEIQKSISQLYCNGYNVDFKCQFKKQNAQQMLSISSTSSCSYLLPHYQWNDNKYWKEGISSFKYRNNGPSTNQLGYKNDESPFISYTSYIDTKEEPFKFLKGHQSRGKPIFPGCGYIDNILKIFPNQDITIENLEFKSTFPLKEGVKSKLVTNLYKSAKNEHRVTYNIQDTTGKWIQSSFGRISTAKHTESIVNKVNVNELKSKCAMTTLNRKEVYESAKIKFDITILESFQRVEEASYGNDKCFAKISLGQVSSYDNDLFFNICILDGCFQLLSLYFENPISGLFDRIEHLKFYSSNIPKSAEDRKKIKYVYSYTEKIFRIGTYLFANIWCFLEDGSVLFHSPMVVFASIGPLKNHDLIEFPNNQIFSHSLQPKDSILQSPLMNKQHYDKHQRERKLSNHSIPISTFSTFLFLKFQKKFIGFTIDEITNNPIDQLIVKYILPYHDVADVNDEVGNDSFGYSKMNLVMALFKILKQYATCINDTINNLSREDENLMTNFSDVMVNNIISNELSNLEIYQHKLIFDVISKSIKPILNEKIIFRILEIGCGNGQLSLEISNTIDKLLNDNPLSEIDIEFTYSDSDDSKATKIRDKLINSKSSCIFKISNLNNSLVYCQSFNPSYYDLIILSDTQIINQNIKSSIGYLNEVLTPNGYLLILDSNFKQSSIDENDNDNYQIWLYFSYLNSKLMKLNEWDNLLVNEFKFNDFVSLTGDIEPFLLQVQKPNLKTSIESIKQQDQFNYDQIIIFGGRYNAYTIEKLTQHAKGTPIIINSIEEFEKHVELKPLTNNSLILFVESTDQLSIDNFNQVSLNYIKINQHLLKNEINGCKHILLTRNVNFESSNYLASTLIGSFRYFSEFNQLNIYSFEFDNLLLNCNQNNLLNTIQELTDSNKHLQREYISRNGKFYYERIKLESTVKLKFKSDSYARHINELVARLDTDLSFKLEAKQPLKSNYVEIKVMAAGINFKDNLVYRNLVAMENSNEHGDQTKPQFGYEMSGIITRIGANVSKFKVGDHVMGLGFHCCSSLVSTDQDRVTLKPSNLTWVEAATTLVYITSYHSLFDLGKLELNGSTETVLIHSGTGGVGLSCIDLLKHYGFKGCLFVTVGSDEKKQFLIDRYGDFITGIYSTKNTDFEQLIISKLLEINKEYHSEKYGMLIHNCVDLIINTLSGDFMDANFRCLSQGGRIVDLSITHINSTDTTDFRKFKNFVGYTSYETVVAGFKQNKYVLKVVADQLAIGKLKVIPIIEYPISQIKNAIEIFGERKHIGKVVVNFDNGVDLLSDTITKSNNKFIYENQLPNYQINENSLGKTILITGQTGLSISIIRWIEKYRSNNIESIIVLSKSPIKYELELIIGKLKEFNSKFSIYHKQADISDVDSISNAINELFNEYPNISPIETIIHNAFAPSECEALDIDMNHLIVSHSAKSIGAINLHKLSLNWPIKQFILSSSVTSLLGSQRQCGYVAANCLLDALSRYRKSIGLPCISINWGLMGDNGFAARNDAVTKLFELQGLIPLNSDVIWGTFDLLLQNQDKSNNIMVSSFDYYNTSKTYRNHKLQYKLDYFLNPIQSKESLNDENELSIKQEILSKFSELLSIEPDRLNLDIKVIDYGADSMLIVEIKNFTDKTFAPNILSISFIQNSTINQIINSISLKMPTFKTTK